MVTVLTVESVQCYELGGSNVQSGVITVLKVGSLQC